MSSSQRGGPMGLDLTGGRARRRLVAEIESRGERVDEHTKTTFFAATREQAVALIQQQPAGTLFGVHLKADALLAREPGVYPSEHGMSCSCGLKISRAQALDIARGAIEATYEARGGRIPLSLYDSGTTRSHWLWLLG